MAGSITRYLNLFFEAFTPAQGGALDADYRTYLHQSILLFLEDENKETAFAVYLTFFDTYKISLGEESNQFLDLLDMMRSYEENAATLTAKQRDHYVHSVNVFLLGLSIYGANERYRACFDAAFTDDPPYARTHATGMEEFFYRWGIASLFHDIGYPVEIISKQANQYLNFVVQAVRGSEKQAERSAGESGKHPARGPVAPEVRTFLEYEDFSAFNRLPLSDAESAEAFQAAFLSVWETTRDRLSNPAPASDSTLVSPLGLLAYSIARRHGVDYQLLKDRLNGFVRVMQAGGFVDHGFYSALIVLQWFAFLMQKKQHDARYFHTTIADCAAAILLHNYYGNVLQKQPFSLGPLRPEHDPLSYLLILCDELQEWNREAYGYEDKGRIAAERLDVDIADDAFKAVYISDESLLGDPFERKKEELLHRRLDLAALFPQGFEVDSVNAGSASWRIQQTFASLPPMARPLIGQLDAIAQEIHTLYLADQQEQQKGEAPEARSWGDLPEDIRYSNLAQARHMADKLRLIGCTIVARESKVGASLLTAFTTEEVESLAYVEHERWMNERLSSGWVYGSEKNVEHKASPYLVPWEDLTEDVKELDRNTVRNIIPLLKKVGLGVQREVSSRNNSRSGGGELK